MLNDSLDGQASDLAFPMRNLWNYAQSSDRSRYPEKQRRIKPPFESSAALRFMQLHKGRESDNRRGEGAKRAPEANQTLGVQVKRFTETAKWEDPWFRLLKPKYKAFFLYLCDRCDNAGVWVVDIDLAVQYIGEKLDREECLKVLAGRVVDMGRGRWLIPQFVSFQYGVLTDKCHPHRRIIEALSRHGLSVREGRTTLTGTLTSTLPSRVEEEDKEEEEDKDKEEEGLPLGDCQRPYDPTNELNSMAVDILSFLNKETGQSFRVIETHLDSIRARIKEVHGDVDGIKKMISRRWEEAKGTDAEKYINPTTLFRPGNFATWYDQRNSKAHRVHVKHQTQAPGTYNP